MTIEVSQRGEEHREVLLASVKRWPVVVLVACTAIVAAGLWVVPESAGHVMSLLLLALVVATFLSLRTALNQAVRSLNTTHTEQLESERRFRTIFDACSDAIAVYPLEDGGRPGRLVEVNQAACGMLGYSRTRLRAMSATDMIAPEARNDLAERLLALHRSGSLVCETAYMTREGHRFPVELSVRLTQLRGQRLCLSIARNIAQRKEREEHWRSLSQEDELTGLLNRRGFFFMAEQSARRAQRLRARALLMYFDVDGLKGVNDRLGHSAGDVLLSAVAAVLRRTFREGDVLARLGGDEFVALALLDRSEERLDVRAIETRLEQALADKAAELGEQFELSLSHGALLASGEDLARIDKLLGRSDELMYEAKRSRHRPRRASGHRACSPRAMRASGTE
jgi:diguanylate cyclase (GGDEF)-like protein/PAS domain S-box-containing protein